MADIEANSGRSLQYSLVPVATAQWSEAVKVRGEPSPHALHAALGASRCMLAHGAAPDAVMLTLTLACAAATHQVFSHMDFAHYATKVNRDIQCTPQASYQPIVISKELVIVPAWQQLPPSDGPAPLHLVLEPGLAFSTGDHPTTQLCLRWLLRRRAALAGAAVVDYGTGSGVLAIAAMLLGASSVV